MQVEIDAKQLVVSECRLLQTTIKKLYLLAPM